MKFLKPRWGRFFTLLGLLFLVSITAWLLHELEQQDLPRPLTEQRRPAYTMRDMEVFRLDPQGRVKSQLQARHMAYYEDDGTELKEPLLVAYEENHPHWYVHAAQGWVSQDGNTVELLEDALLLNYDQNGAQRLELHADNMTIKPEENYAETKAPVYLKLPRGEIHSVGMKAFIARREIEFSAQVKAHHAF